MCEFCKHIGTELDMEIKCQELRTENGNVFDKATVGREFAKFAEEAALQGDEAAIDILKKASLELFRNVDVAYENANLKEKQQCEGHAGKCTESAQIKQ